jgi:hypothetical protein
MPAECTGLIVPSYETAFDGWAFLAAYRCARFRIGCAEIPGTTPDNPGVARKFSVQSVHGEPRPDRENDTVLLTSLGLTSYGRPLARL